MQGLGRAMLYLTLPGAIPGLAAHVCCNSGGASNAKLWGGHVMIHTSCIHFPGYVTISIPEVCAMQGLGGAVLCFTLPGLIPVIADIPSDKSNY